MFGTLSFIARHPLTRRRQLAAIGRYLKWQLQSRLRDEVEFSWIGGSKLVVRNGMTGATGNIYCGLHEFPDMAFLLHLLRPGDLFVDVGANVGSYTVLAARVSGADVVAVEPDPNTMTALRRNTTANSIENKVQTIEAALGSKPGTARFTVGLDTVNRIATSDEANTRVVEVLRLDDLLVGKSPVMMKVDVEGFETDVFSGGHALLANPSLLAIETEGQEKTVTDQLESAGFSRWYYDPFSRELSQVIVRHSSTNALFLRDIEQIKNRLDGAPRFTVLGRLI